MNILGNNSIIYPLLAGLALGTLINSNENLIQGLSDFAIYGAIFIYLGASRFMKIPFTHDVNTTASSLWKRFFSIMLIIFGLLIISATIFFRTCYRFGMNGVVNGCECKGIIADLDDTFTFLHSDSDTDGKVVNYCIGIVRSSTTRSNF